MGVPSTTASSGSGNIYFQISAPTSYSWVALGTGTQMSGSNIFIMYQDGQGNVTVSARPGTGHREPEYDASTASQLTLLSGSGVTGDTMVANVRCANCESWSSGSGTLDVASSGSSWIGAWKSGSSLASTSASESISYHDAHSEFNLDLTQASITSDSNPFVGAEATTPSSSGSSGSSGTTTVRPSSTIIWAHGLGMAIAFAILYPLGSSVMPLFGKWQLHSG